MYDWKEMVGAILTMIAIMIGLLALGYCISHGSITTGLDSW